MEQDRLHWPRVLGLAGHLVLGARIAPRALPGALVDRALAEAARRVRLLAAVGVTANADALTDDARAGRHLDRGARPSFVRSDPDVRRALEPIAEGRDERGGALRELAVARAEELLLELDMIDAMETPALRELARRRYLRGDEADARGDELAREWLAERDERPSATAAEAVRRLDDPSDPRSLVSRLRAELSRLAIPFRVSVRPGLSPLAATAPGEVQVAAGKLASDEAIERTVVHEVLGHAAPMHRAFSAGLAVFAYASAHGSDEQEGYAIGWEERRGHLVGGRRRELALRHVAARAVHAGAELDDVVGLLVRAGAELGLAVRVGLRVTRGAGLARECVYLPAWLRVREAGEPIAAVLANGRVSVAAARALGP